MPDLDLVEESLRVRRPGKMNDSRHMWKPDKNVTEILHSGHKQLSTILSNYY